MNNYSNAQNLASYGRGNDTELVHMTPGEIKGLQALALANGGSLTIFNAKNIDIEEKILICKTLSVSQSFQICNKKNIILDVHINLITQGIRTPGGKEPLTKLVR